MKLNTLEKCFVGSKENLLYWAQKSVLYWVHESVLLWIMIEETIVYNIVDLWTFANSYNMA